jgi:3-phosphoshikimate 1-carboxyvinyltransferase
VSDYRLEIRPARTISGTLEVPGDKSISHRYVLLGAVARGARSGAGSGGGGAGGGAGGGDVTTATHLAPGADVAATIACVRALGAEIEATGPDAIRVRGLGRRGLRSPSRELDAANSGTTMRLLAGLVAGHPFRTTLSGDASLRRRPMRRVIDPLTAMGARIASSDGRAPLVIDGGDLTSIAWRTEVASAQVKSAVLLAGLHARGTTSVEEPIPTRDHTERAFRAFGLDISVSAVGGPTCSISVEGGQEARPPLRPLRVPGDPSSAAVWAAAAAALPGSAVRIERVCLNPHRLGFARALERMGATVEVQVEDEEAGEAVGSIRVSHADHRATSIDPADVPSLIDELPVLAARAALGAGLEVTGAGELRVKESDRITALVAGLCALGVDARERPDGFIIDGRRQPRGGTADANGDHRLVMAFAIVALGASGPSIVTGADVVGVSYPSFGEDLTRLTR